MRQALLLLAAFGLAALLCLGTISCASKAKGGQGNTGTNQPAVATQALSPDPGPGSAQGSGPAAPASATTAKPSAPAQGQPAAPKAGQPAAQALAPVTVTAKKVQQNTETIQVDLSIPVIAGLQDSKLQERLNNRFEQDALDFKNELAKQAGEDIKEEAKAGYPFRQYSAVTAYKVAYNQDGLLSITVDYYQYTGGAHGGTDRRPYNYDLTTGQELALQDLFKQGVKYVETINREIGKQIAANPEGGYFTQPDMEFQTIADNQPFYLTAGGLVVYFGQYEIAPYAAGIPEFQLPYSLFKVAVQPRLLGK